MAHDLPGPLSAAILQQSADAIIYADRGGRIQLWNGAAERMFGFTAEQALGQRLDIVIPEHLRMRHWVGYRMAMETGMTKHLGRRMLTKGLHRSVETPYVEMSFAVINDPQSGTVGSVAIAREPREQKAPAK
jgi:PAS domain S-box-containing protein